MVCMSEIESVCEVKYRSDQAWQLERGRRGEACLQCSCSALDRLLSSTTRRSAYKTLPDSTHHPILLRILTI
ncbi:hypothetical protein Y032_0153g2915 [Ancylostoma ceylanicum]|uniref:Uncharacterized protein n=1 Tax=Ancylostoma ceylanicum TaxID=53326 RepID=A0A016T0G0_9BILA|nr:hypothetical protein Y032_0153g2915 [Ancylostoma ceylanicum]